MVRRLAAAIAAVAIFLTGAVATSPSAHAFKYEPPNYYFNTWEQSLMATAGIGYVATRLRCGANCGLIVSVAAGWVAKNGICSKRRLLKVTVIGVPLWARCVSGLRISGGTTGGGGGGGGGSWRPSSVRA